MVYSELEIFKGITNREVEAMESCFRMRRGRYRPGEAISLGAGEVGVLLQGAAELVRFDYGGNRTILERLEPGGVFGEGLAFAPDLGDGMEVISRGPAEVLFMEYSHIMKRCEKACGYHSKLVQNMFHLVAEQSKRLSLRVEVLSRRSIRDKLGCYFQIRRMETGCSSFTLPFSYSALAEYISSDRSAMMRELKKLRTEGIISVDRRQITLLGEINGKI